MITLKQDADGYIRMNKHFPQTVQLAIAFTDGSVEQFSGSQLNAIYDAAQAAFRAENHLDAKGFSRRPAKTVQPKSTIQFVAVQPGMSTL
jgi:hypothetical protein